MSEDSRPDDKADNADGISTTDAAAASILVLMCLLPALHKSKVLKGERFLKMLDDVAGGTAADLNTTHNLLHAVEGIVGPLRHLIEQQRKDEQAASAAASSQVKDIKSKN